MIGYDASKSVYMSCILLELIFSVGVLQFNGHELFTVRRKWKDLEKSGNERLFKYL